MCARIQSHRRQSSSRLCHALSSRARATSVVGDAHDENHRTPVRAAACDERRGANAELKLAAATLG